MNKRKTFYSGYGCNLLNQDIEKVIKNFTNGVYYDEQKGIEISLSNILNNYNKEFVIRCGEIIDKYITLVTVESFVTKIMYELLECNIYFSATSNIRRIMRAQSQTISVYRDYRKALGKYRISHKKVYQVFKREFEKVETRYESNKKIMSIWLNDYGFSELVSLLEQECGLTFFDYAYEYAQTYYIDNYDLSNMTKDEYYANLKKAFYDTIMNFCEKHSIDLCQNISKKVEEIYDNNEIIKRRIKEEERIKKEKELSYLRKYSIDKDNACLFHILTDSYDVIKKTRPDHYNIMGMRSKYDGKILKYIVVVRKTNVLYLKRDLKTTKSFNEKILFFDNVELSKCLEEGKKQYPTAYVGVCELCL